MLSTLPGRPSSPTMHVHADVTRTSALTTPGGEQIWRDVFAPPRITQSVKVTYVCIAQCFSLARLHHCTMRFLLWRSVNRKIYQNVYLGPHFHFHFLICLVFPGVTLVKTTKIMIIISKVFFTMKGCTDKKAYFGLFFCKYFFLNLTKLSPFSDPPFSIFHKKIT